MVATSLEQPWGGHVVGPAYPLEHGRIEALNDHLHAAARALLDLPVVDESQLSDQLDALAPAAQSAPVVRNEALLRTTGADIYGV